METIICAADGNGTLVATGKGGRSANFCATGFGRFNTSDLLVPGYYVLEIELNNDADHWVSSGATNKWLQVGKTSCFIPA